MFCVFQFSVFHFLGEENMSESNAVKPVDVTIENDRATNIVSVNGKGKKRGRKEGETMALIEAGGVMRRFSNRELVQFYLAAATIDASGLPGLVAQHGRPLPTLPPPIVIDDWEIADFLSAIGELQK